MWERLRNFLEQREAENHLFLGVLSSAPEGTRPVLVEENEEIKAACIFVERNVVAAGDRLRAAQLVSQWEIDAPGVVARADLASAWSEQWTKKRGCQAHLAVSQRIFRLNKVIRPGPTPGRLRLAGLEDLAILTEWIEGFDREALAHERSPRAQIESWAVRRARSGMTYFWEVEGRPVSMAALARPSRNAICVNLVYTPEADRGRGYASAVVAGVSQEGLDQGFEFCTLYTDLSNPTSNSIYAKLGYQPVCDSRHYQFTYSA
ncbi:MAG: GNAT family N-acetyltransferase [Vulcanimicrobiota bacterium]